LASATKEVSKLQSSLDAKEKEKAAVTAENAELRKQLAAKEQALASALTENATLQVKLESKEVEVEAINPTIPHGGETYRLTATSFKYDGQIHTLESLKKNKAVVAELVKRNAGVLVKVEK
jgi:chromosome segregation ATPase